MDNTDNFPQNQDNFIQGTPENNQEPVELSHTDKMVGIFTEPENTFISISKFRVKVIDWLLPLLIVGILSAVGYYIRMNNPIIKNEALSKIEKGFDKQVQDKKLSQEQADKAFEQTKKFFESPVATILTSLSTVIFLIFVFFIYALIIYVAVRFILGGKNSFTAALPPIGLTYYIIMLSVIVGIILSMIYNTTINDASIAGILNIPIGKSFLYIVLSVLDIIAIYALFIQSIGLKIMYGLKSNIPIFIIGLVITFGLKILGVLFS